jgi:predicted nucleotidyltransferase component of viral defense system
MRLKLEINMKEHFSVLGYEDTAFTIDSPWYSGQALLKTFSLNELLATKMRALYQRKKERDLFDLWYALTFCTCKPDIIVDCYLKYMAYGDKTVRRADFEANMQAKLTDRDFQSDLSALLRPGLKFNPETAYKLVSQQLISLIPV